MTWEEKINLVINDYHEYVKEMNIHLFDEWSNSRKSLLQLQTAIKDGNIELVRETLPAVKTAWEKWKIVYRTAKKYGKYQLHFATQFIEGVVYVGFFLDKTEKNILSIDRLVNHAEIRCLKHRKFQQAH